MKGNKWKKTALLMALAGSCMMVNPAYAAGWKQDQKGYWYENENGSYWRDGWQWINNRCYYFNEEGYCLLDTVTPDGYQVDATGAWVENGIVKEQEPASSAQNLEGLYGWHNEYGDALLNIKKQGDGYYVEGNTVQGQSYHTGDITGNMVMISDTVGCLDFGNYKVTLIWAASDHIIVEEDGYPDGSSYLEGGSVSLGWNVGFSGDYYYEGPPEEWEAY